MVEGREAGFTLVEVLVAIVIEALIMGALGMAFVGILNGSSSVNQSLSRSADARIAANYIVSDARNSSGPEVSLADTTSCPDPNPPVTGTATPVVRFNWSTPSSSGTTTSNVANYVLVSNTLLRRECQAGNLVQDKAVASNVSSVTVVCWPTANCTGTPISITVGITELADSSGAVYQYNLTGAFRKLIGGGPPVASGPSQSVVLLGSGGSCSAGVTGISASGSGNMTVYGTALINTADGPSCKAMSLSNSGAFTAGKTSFLTGGSCVASGASVCPTPSTYSPAIADPYASLAAPATAGLPAQTGCTGAQASQTAQPGMYASGFTLGGGNTCTLASGIYVVQNGFNLSNGATLKTGAGGVLIYLMSGQFAVGGGASVTLTAMTSGTYSGLTLWQAAANTSTISLSNGGALVFNGAIYGPKAQLNISGNAQTPAVTALVVQTIILTNSGGITVGTPLAITAPATLPTWTANAAYPPTTLTGTGGGGAYSWSATGLPAGLSIGATTGIISGTPTAAGAPSVTITLNDASGDAAATRVYTLNAAPAISTTSPLPAGEKTTPYNTTVAGTGGSAPYSWSATGLPAGLSIAAGTGTISGTPTATGTSTPSVTLTDAVGAIVSKNLSITIAAQPTITSVTLANGTGTAGTIEQGDTITIVFSAQMKVSTLCSTWATDASNQSLNADNDVTVTVSNANPDAVTVTSATCTFRFGSVNLASNSYTSVAATFKGAGASKSTVTWTASTHTLVITLGAKTAGTVANVATSTPVYTASGDLRDSAGGLLGNSPLTLPAGKQF